MGGNSYDFKDKLSGERSLIPILGTVRVALPYKKFRAYIRGGVGYYMGKIAFKWDQDLRKNGNSIEKRSLEWEASGKAIIPHIDGGFDFDISENLLFSADLKYPIGKIKTFKVDKNTEDPDSVGKP
ncbi:MAG: hypothetical protein ACUVR0_08070 [Candidatus Aminicenantales bacterium]